MMKWTKRTLLLLSGLILIYQGCGESKSNTATPDTRTSTETRSFRMGFSPWPWDSTVTAVDWTWNKILQHGDVVSFHLEEGVPWNESLNGTPFPANYLNSVNGQLAKVTAGTSIVLQVNALNIGRDGLAPFRGANPNENLTAPWTTYSLNSPQVKSAYANYVERMINWVKPQWVLIGIESNLYMRKKKATWPQYVDLLCSTVTSLKSRGVTIPIYVSLFSVPFFPQWSPEDNLPDQQKTIEDLAGCLDGFAISTHPFMSGLLAESFPDDYFSTLFSYSDKWVGISEASYPAQVWSLNGLTWNGTPSKQSQFLVKLLEASQSKRFKFVIWYAVRDYDQLWSGVLNNDPLALIWRDTGLYDENGQPREGLGTWSSEFKKIYSP